MFQFIYILINQSKKRENKRENKDILISWKRQLSPLIPNFTLCGFSYTWSTEVSMQMTILLKDYQKAERRRTLCHLPHFISSHRPFASHNITRRVKRVQKDILKDPIHELITVYFCNRSILLSVLCYSLTLTKLEIKLYHSYVCIWKKQFIQGSVFIWGFRYPLGGHPQRQGNSCICVFS